MQRRTEVSNDAQDMNRAKCFATDLPAKVKGERDQQKNVETDNAQPHPDWAIRIYKGNEDLKDVERQILIE